MQQRFDRRYLVRAVVAGTVGSCVEFYDFVLSDGQALLAELNHVISHRRNERNLRKFDLKFIELDAVLADYDRWTKIFEDTIYGRSAGFSVHTASH